MRTYTDEELQKAIQKCTSIRQVLKELGLKEAGGNYITVKNAISRLNIDTPHFTGKGWNKNLKFKPNPPQPIQELLKKNTHYQSNKLRKRLMNEGFFEHKCYKCQNQIWNGLPIPIELEHIDGDNSNNELSNLTLLCPNCHAQTSTWRRRKS
jgi:Zn finger protein HypA/HybF involved in hydrogenase expression